MGDFLKKQQAENFKKAREKAMRDAQQQTLVPRELKCQIAVTIVPVQGQKLVANEALTLVPQDTFIAALRGCDSVGIIEGEAAEVARQAMQAIGTPSAIKVLVTDISDISGVAHAQMLHQ